MKENQSPIKGLLTNLDIVLAGCALTILVFVTFTGVFTRYLLNQPFAWCEEVQLACFVWITFLGLGAAFRSGSHVAIELLVDKMPAPIARIVELCDYLITMVIIGFIFYHSTVIVQSMVNMARDTNILHIPYAAIYVVVPISCVLMIYNFSVVTYHKFKSNKESEVN